MLLTPPAGVARWCDKKTHRGFLAERSYYLSSCENRDGTFAFFSVVSATSGSPKLNSPYYKARLVVLCASGHAYATGVKGRFVNTYAGTGAGEEIANCLAGTAAESFKTANGYVAPVKLC